MSMIKTAILVTIQCDMPGCLGGVGGARTLIEREKQSGDPVLLPPGWSVLLWRNDAGSPQAPDVHVCGSCFRSIPKLLGLRP